MYQQKNMKNKKIIVPCELNINGTGATFETGSFAIAGGLWEPIGHVGRMVVGRRHEHVGRLARAPAAETLPQERGKTMAGWSRAGVCSLWMCYCLDKSVGGTPVTT